MAIPLIRVDLSDAAVDFQAVATEPGLPMLDRQGAADAILARWLGDLAAEPQWQPDGFVHFFVRQGEHGRLEDVAAQPLTADDMRGPLKQDVEQLRARVERIRPQSADEQLLAKILRQTAAKFDPHDRHAARRRIPLQIPARRRSVATRLVLGYQRIGRAPAEAVVCPNPQCRLLFLRRPRSKTR